MRCSRLLVLSPLLLFILPAGLHAQISSIQRKTYGSPLIDSVPLNHFPRGGSYTAVIQGAGLAHVTGFTASNPNVSGSVSSASDSSVIVQINSTDVAQGGDIWTAGTANAPIPAVSFTLSQTPPPGQLPLGPISSGTVTFDIVVGPTPQLSNYKVTNSIKWIPAGVPITVEYGVDVLHAGDIVGFSISGCGPCVGAFGTITGTQFTNHVQFQAAVNAPNDFTYIKFPFSFSAINGSGAFTDPVDPGTLTLPVVQMQLVDPVPALLDGSAVTSDSTLLGNQGLGTIVKGVAADGVTTLVIRIAGAPPNETLSLNLVQDGALANTGSASFGSGTSVQADSSGNALVLYRAPLDYAHPGDDISASSRVVHLNFTSFDNNPAVIVGDTKITVVRPPVILVHGLWDDRSAWDGFAPLTSDSRFFVRTVDYAGIIVAGITSTSPAFPPAILANVKQSALGFAYNAPNVLAQVRKYISEFKRVNQVAAIQADIVAHSMGGDISRSLRLQPLQATYLSSDTFAQGPIHKLVTIGTPHLGTPLATQLLQAQNSCVRNLLAKKGNIAFSTVTFSPTTYSGGVGDLQGDGFGGGLSIALQNIRSSSVHPVPTAAIAGTMNAVNLSGLNCTLCVASYIAHHCKTNPLAINLTAAGWRTVFGQDSDAIVPRTSQLNGTFGIEFSSPGLVHSAGTEKLDFLGPSELDQASGIPGKVIDLLNEATSGIDFRSM